MQKWGAWNCEYGIMAWSGFIPKSDIFRISSFLNCSYSKVDSTILRYSSLNFEDWTLYGLYQMGPLNTFDIKRLLPWKRELSKWYFFLICWQLWKKCPLKVPKSAKIQKTRPKNVWPLSKKEIEFSYKWM